MIPVPTINQRREHSHSFEQIADRLVGDRTRLLDHRDPAGRFDRREGIEFSSLFDVTALVGANIADQRLRRVGNRAGIRFEIVR